MIPPSSQFVLYGTIVGVSIADMFAAGVAPGLFVGRPLHGVPRSQGQVNPEIAPDDEKPQPWGASLKAALGLWPIVVIMVAAVGPIYAGWCTTTESAGVGAFASIVIGAVFGKLRWKEAWVSVQETTRITCMLFFIIIGAMALATAVSSLGMARHTIDYINSLGLSKFWMLVIIYILYLFLGCLFDGISMMLMTLPFIFPITEAMGFNAVWFGVMLCLVIEIAMVTPPVGMNLYVIMSVAGKNAEGKQASVWDIFSGAVPFLICSLIVLAVITVWPGFCLYLPGLLGRH